MIFNSEAALGAARERNCRLCTLLDDFNDKRLDLRLSAVGNRDRVGDGYDYPIGTFAADAGKKTGAFYTPPDVSILVFSKGRELWVLAQTERDRNVLFIDASRECADGMRQNQLRDEDIGTIVRTDEAFVEVESYAQAAALERSRRRRCRYPGNERAIGGGGSG